jgi:hypothetical protein
MADIRKHAVEPTAVLHLRDANDELLYNEPVPDNASDEWKEKHKITVTLYGPGSKPFARASAVQHNKMVDKLKRKGKTDQSAEQKAEETAEFLTSVTKDMSNMEYDKLTGEALAKAVYTDITVGFIPEQVDKFLRDWGNFSKASSTTSPSTSASTPG